MRALLLRGREKRRRGKGKEGKGSPFREFLNPPLGMGTLSEEVLELSPNRSPIRCILP